MTFTIGFNTTFTLIFVDIDFFYSMADIYHSKLRRDWSLFTEYYSYILLQISMYYDVL